MIAAKTLRESRVRSAVYGPAPRRGRAVAAVGNRGADMREACTALYLGSPAGDKRCLFRDSSPQPYGKALAEGYLAPREVSLRVGLGMGEAEATAWGCFSAASCAKATGPHCAMTQVKHMAAVFESYWRPQAAGKLTND